MDQTGFCLFLCCNDDSNFTACVRKKAWPLGHEARYICTKGKKDGEMAFVAGITFSL